MSDSSKNDLTRVTTLNPNLCAYRQAETEMFLVSLWHRRGTLLDKKFNQSISMLIDAF